MPSPFKKKIIESILSGLITIRLKLPKICANRSVFGSRAREWQCLDPGEEQFRLVNTRNGKSQVWMNHVIVVRKFCLPDLWQIKWIKE